MPGITVGDKLRCVCDRYENGRACYYFSKHKIYNVIEIVIEILSGEEYPIIVKDDDGDKTSLTIDLLLFGNEPNGVRFELVEAEKE